MLGIINVGSWVLATAAGLRLLTRNTGSSLSLLYTVLVVLLALGIQAGFDFAGGAWLVPAPRPSVARLLRTWLRGFLGQGLVLALIVALHYGSFRLSGGFVAGVVVGTIGLAVGRVRCLRLVAGVPIIRQAAAAKNVLLAEATDPAFTGAMVGLGEQQVNVWPASWHERVPADERAAEESRRQWQAVGGRPHRTLGLILLWNALGSALGTYCFHLAVHPPLKALVLHACWMTLSTFGSLLILPSLSRPAVYAADRAALDAGHDPRAWIARFADLVGEDGSSHSLVQTIFYPVPSVQRRWQQLTAEPVVRIFGGNPARANLYYSWASGTLLGRAVHCNVGRPALWVFPPSD